MDDLDGLISAWATSWVGTKGVSIVLSYLFSALRTPVFGSRREAGRSECAISRLRQENPDRWNGRLWRARVIGVRTMERVSDVAREHVEDLCPAERRCARALLADYPGRVWSPRRLSRRPPAPAHRAPLRRPARPPPSSNGWRWPRNSPAASGHRTHLRRCARSTHREARPASSSHGRRSVRPSSTRAGRPCGNCTVPADSGDPRVKHAAS